MTKAGMGDAGAIAEASCGSVVGVFLRYRRLGPRYDWWSSVVSVLLAIAAVLAVCIWALDQVP